MTPPRRETTDDNGRNFIGITSLLPKPSSSMLSYRAKRINKFTSVNLKGTLRQPAQRDFSLRCFSFNRFAHSNRRLLCSTRSGVTCHSSAAAKQRFPELNHKDAVLLGIECQWQ